MKPRTQYQQMVCKSDKGLPPIGKRAMKWAVEELTKHYAYHTPNSLRYNCMDCGHQWNITDNEKSGSHLVCPCCGRTLKVKDTYDRTLHQSAYFTILTTRDRLQVLRVALVKTEQRKGERVRISCQEICRYYLDEQGRCAVIGLKRTMGPYLDCFSYYTGMELRYDNDVYSHLATFPLYPKTNYIPELERNGFTGEFYELAPLTMFKAILSDHRYETLIKSGRTSHFCHFITRPVDLDVCWDSYKTALRSHYRIDNIGLWCDLIRMLRSQGKDIHNPHYICPKDLQTEHDRLTRKINEQAERKRKKKETAIAAKNEEKFKQMKGKFFGLSFTDGLISIKVLESVEEHRQEGAHMHHCVFSASYYLNEDSLIFSATINGERVETVEFDLKQFRVAQSRGVCNKNTEYHDRIVSLVNRNADSIRQRMKIA